MLGQLGLAQMLQESSSPEPIGKSRGVSCYEATRTERVRRVLDLLGW